MNIFQKLFGSRKELKQTEQQMKMFENNVWTMQKIYRTDVGLSDWKNAIESCFTAPYYNFVPLYDLYDNAILDDVVFSSLETRFSGSVAENFALYDKNGNKNEEATQIIQKSWFLELLYAIVETKAWGYTTIQFDYADFFANNEFTTFTKIPRQNINPRRRVYLRDPYGDLEGESLDKFSLVLEFGKIDGNYQSLGLLVRPAKRVMYKNFTVSDWAKYNEKFGMPHRYVKTSAKDKQAYYELLDNFGRNGFSVFDDSDEIGALNATASTNVDTFKMFIDFNDTQIAKSLVGQTATMEQKSYVGSAEVQERKLDWWVESDMKYIEYEINSKVLKFLAKQGRAYKGIDEFKFEFEFFHERRNLKETTPQTTANENNLNLKCCDDDDGYPFARA
jgi:hypothetical protein